MFKSYSKVLPFILLPFLISCGEDNTSSEEIGAPTSSVLGGTSSNAESSCFGDSECSDTEYCQATDSTISPEGQCAPLQVQGEACTRGTACSENLICIKERSTGEGTCRSFPDSCSSAPTCDCALQSFCVSLAGSSCSVEVMSDPNSSMTATCAEVAQK